MVELASRNRIQLAHTIDMCLLIVASFLSLIVANLLAGNRFGAILNPDIAKGWPVVIVFFAPPGYLVIVSRILSRTFGQWFLGVKIISEHGRGISWKQASIWAFWFLVMGDAFRNNSDKTGSKDIRELTRGERRSSVRLVLTRVIPSKRKLSVRLSRRYRK